MKTKLLIALSAFLIAAANIGQAQISLHERGPFPSPVLPPSLQIVTPEDGAVILGPANVEIYAEAAHFTDTVASVEFLAGTNTLDVVTNGIKIPCREGAPSEFFGFTWSNTPPGSYSLTAIATDADGNSVTSSVVDIDVVTNIPPVVHIARPRDGATILTSSNIEVCAFAFDPEGTVADVELFAGDTLVGMETNAPIMVTNGAGVFTVQERGYCFDWMNPAAGTYTLTAVATDNGGVSSTSPPVTVTVVSNLPPTVELLKPHNNSSFYSTADVGVTAIAADIGGTVAGVEFFLGTSTVGTVTNVTTYTNCDTIYGFYSLTLSNLAVGTYAVTAVAANDTGEMTTSAPVNITIVSPPPPAVYIINPRNGERFFAPARIDLLSFTRFFPDPVASVEYFAGTTSIGTSTNGPGFGFCWTNVGAGSYTLTATATDVSGTNVVTSPPVDITVRSNSWTFGRW